MIYIKLNADESVTLGGTVANEQMLLDGWQAYEGEIVSPLEYEALRMVDGELQAVTNEDKVAQYKEKVNKAIQSTLDKQAQALRYDSMISARSYAGYVNAFQEECTKLASWSSACWEAVAVMEQEYDNTGELMTVEDVISILPVYEA